MCKLYNKYDAYRYCEKVIKNCNNNLRFYGTVCNLIDNFNRLYNDSYLYESLRQKIQTYLIY